MRILLLEHPQFTSGTYLLWHGLKELEDALNGQLRVDVYPPLPTHYDQDSFNVADQQWFKDLDAIRESGKLPFGIPPFAPGELLNNQDQKVVTRCEIGRRFTPYDLPGDGEYLGSIDDVSRMLSMKRYDLIILGNSHRVPTMVLSKLYEKVRRMPPVVYYDAGERDELNEHWIHAFRPALVFKQILTPEVLDRGMTVPVAGYTLEMLPLPLSSPLVGNPRLRMGPCSMESLRMMDGPNEKMLDVFYSMGITWPERQQVLDFMDALVKKHSLHTLGGQQYHNYHLALAKSRMAVTMRGSGRDTLRYWEIPLYSTAMLSDGTMGCVHPYPFEHLKTAIFWKNEGYLGEQVLRYRADSGTDGELRKQVAQAGKKHLATYHSCAARAMFFLDMVKEKLGLVDPGLQEPTARWKQGMGWDGRPWRGAVE